MCNRWTFDIEHAMKSSITLDRNMFYHYCQWEYREGQTRRGFLNAGTRCSACSTPFEKDERDFLTFFILAFKGMKK